MAWLAANWQVVLGAAYVIINEIVALAPNLKSNSIVQLVVNVLKSLVPAKLPPA